VDGYGILAELGMAMAVWHCLAWHTGQQRHFKDSLQFVQSHGTRLRSNADEPLRGLYNLLHGSVAQLQTCSLACSGLEH
jgi:hypothetical protein